MSGGDRLTRMFFLKFGQIVDIFINDDPQVVPLVMRCDLALREGF